jgi:hypothetical protein
MDFKVLISDNALAHWHSCDEANRIVNVLHFWHGAQRPPKFS